MNTKEAIVAVGKEYQKRFSPVCSSKQFNASVAQLVEHGIEDPSVGGSIPSGGTSFETVSDNCN